MMTSKRIINSAIALIISLAVTGCKGNQAEPQQEDFTLMISVTSPLTVKTSEEVTFKVYSKKGPKTTDVVVLKLQGTKTEVQCAITKADESSFTFVIADETVSGTYDFCIRRGNITKTLGTIVLTVEKEEPEDPQVQPEEGSTIYGKVHCDGTPLEGVVVSDGYLVTATDAKGVYQLKSEKKNKMVYISTPSGYTASCIGVQAQFYQSTKYSTATAERHDFSLKSDGDQTSHKMLFFGDIHLADRNDDRNQFALFTTDVSNYLKAHSGEKIYAMTLGDMIWDLYWYENDYYFSNYLADVNQILNLTIYHTIGNHDHNMKTSVAGTSAGWEAVDWDTAGEFRSNLGPNYYSFNIGQVHYIVLDDIYCKNTTGGTSDDRDYETQVVPDGLSWLKKDLQYVPKTTPLVVTMHAPLYYQNGSAYLENGSTLLSAFDGYNVRFVTGHTHKMWTVDKGNIHENNSGAVCAAWWWSGYYCPGLNIAQDGAPGGYRIMSVNGSTMTSAYKGTGQDETTQFRSYDRNCINIVPADYGVTTYASEFNTMLSECGGYNSGSSANQVLINVWDWNSKWNVEVYENGNPLAVTRINSYDPLYIITYCANRYKKKSVLSFPVYCTYHIFRATASGSTSTLEIKVTDDEGRTYTESMKRPKAFTTDTYK